MFSFLSYNFVLYALIIAGLIAASAALLSPFLVLNEQALIADGLAHVGFTGIIIGLYYGVPILPFCGRRWIVPE